MQFSVSALFFVLLPYALAIPVADPSPNDTSLSSPLLERDAAKDSGKGKDKCQKPIAQNLCTSGVPYCCSGTGLSQVCGPAGTVQCQSIAICCINTNGVSILASVVHTKRKQQRTVLTSTPLDANLRWRD